MATNRNDVLTLDNYDDAIKGAPDGNQRFKKSDQNGDEQLRLEEFVSAPVK